MSRHAVIHAHFYQPPREHPWYDEIERQPSAAPWHDWNERIERECYRTVVAARRHSPDGRIVDIVNTLEWISFNIGPTLCTWMDRHAPDTMQRIVAADRLSVRRLGHGNAMAQPYHHVILPLASRRDKRTEVLWGMADFRKRFGREPEGMWLPETAVDDETLDVLAEAGIRFTVLAPGQLAKVPANGMAMRHTTANGRTIALFAYDGDLSHGVAFGGLLRNAEQWADAMQRRAVSRAGTPQLVSIATDGETYGHHHKFSEIALAHVIGALERRGSTVENFASVLARYGAVEPAELIAPSAWSCAHGVDRWRLDCGCRLDASANPSQAWRAPLRAAVDAAARELHAVFDHEGRGLFGDPWAARDAFGTVDAGAAAPVRQAFLNEWLPPTADGEDRVRALELLEMERDALRMATSCAWFFDDIGGIEVEQNLRYLARAAALSGDGPRIEAAVVATLEQAVSNRQEVGTGAAVYRRVRSAPDPFLSVACADAALRELGLDPAPHLPIAFAVEPTSPDGTQVTYHPTGGAALVRIERAPQRDGDPVWAVGRNGLPPDTVTLADTPERARQVMRARRRHLLLPQILTPEEQRQLAQGDASLRALAHVALTRAVAALGSRTDASSLVLAHGMMDLFHELEEGAPFDAQSAFWAVWVEASRSRRTELRELGARLGFDLPAD